MLVELHVVDLGIVADLSLVLGPGLTAITGETGAGKTLIVEAVELLVGGRADAALVRDGADEARVEGRFVHPETGEETVLARVIPREGRSRAYVDGRLATAGELTELGGHLVDLHGQHAHQSLLDPAVQRAALDRYAGPVALDALAAYREARAALRAVDVELEALGGDARARAREIDLLRFQVEEIAAADLEDPAEDVALEAEELLLADAVAHREALTRAYEALEGPALDALGVAVAALDGRAPFAELAARLRGAQGELADIEQELRHEVERVDDDPARVETVRTPPSPAARAQPEVRRHPRRGHGLRRRGRRPPRRAGPLRGTGRCASRPSAPGTRRRPPRPRPTCRPPATPPPSRWPGPIEVHLRELAMPARGDGGRGRAGGAHRRRPRPGHLPPGPQPGGDRPAAGPGRVRRRALPRDAGGARGAVRGAAHPGVRRGRRRDRRGGRRRGRAAAADARDAHQVLCVTHLAQVAAFADTQVVVEKAVEQVGAGGRDDTTPHASRAPRSSTATPGWPSCRACSRASATRRTPAGTRPSCSRPPPPSAAGPGGSGSRTRRGKR